MRLTEQLSDPERPFVVGLAPINRRCCLSPSSYHSLVLTKDEWQTESAQSPLFPDRIGEPETELVCSHVPLCLAVHLRGYTNKMVCPMGLEEEWRGLASWLGREEQGKEATWEFRGALPRPRRDQEHESSIFACGKPWQPGSSLILGEFDWCLFTSYNLGQRRTTAAEKKAPPRLGKLVWQKIATPGKSTKSGNRNG